MFYRGKNAVWPSQEPFQRAVSSWIGYMFESKPITVKHYSWAQPQFMWIYYPIKLMSCVGPWVSVFKDYGSSLKTCETNWQKDRAKSPNAWMLCIVTRIASPPSLPHFGSFVPKVACLHGGTHLNEFQNKNTCDLEKSPRNWRDKKKKYWRPTMNCNNVFC